MSTDALIFTGSGLLLLGLTIIYRHSQNKKLCGESEKWPYVEGKIVKNEIDYFLGQNSVKSYQIDIAFEYQVGGESYLNNTPTLFSLLGTEEEAEEMGSKFKVGEQVKVFYNPQKHNQATLITGSRVHKKLHEISAGSLLIFFGLMQI